MTTAVGASGAACIFVMGSTAQASASHPHPTAAPIEEIVITGEKQDGSRSNIIQAGTFRGADQLDTPMTVSVVTDEVIRSQQDLSLSEVLRNSAGVTGLLVSPSVLSNVSMRGIPIDARTNFKLNGSLSAVNFIEQPLEDKARVEALKGVSALYYGFSTPSGIINMVIRGPPRMLELSGSISANNYGQVQVTADGGATSGIFGYRLTVAGGTIDSGIDHTRGDRGLQAATVSIQPSDSIKFDLNLEHIRRNVTEPTILQGPIIRSQLLTQLPRLPDPRENAGSSSFMNRASETNLVARMRWDFASDWTLTTEGGFSDARRDRRLSMLAQFEPVSGLGTLTVQAANGQLYRNSEIRADATGNLYTGAFMHKFVFGFARQQSRQYFAPPVIAAGFLNRAGCIQLGLGSSCRQSAFAPVALREVNFDGNAAYDPTRDTKNVDTGLYLFDRVSFGGASRERFQLILGARQSQYRQFVAVSRNQWTRTFTAHPATFSVAALYRPVPSATLYASYIDGIESEPPAPNLTLNQGQILPPGKSRQREAGVKIKPTKTSLLSLAYFDIDRRLTYVNSSNRFVNDGTGHFRGIEAGVNGDITPSLSIIGSALLLDAREDVPGDPVINEKRVENSAHWQWSVFAEYKLSRWLNRGGVSAGLAFTGKRAINPENSLFVPGYATVDIGGYYGMKIARAPITVRVNAANLFSKRYVASTGSNLLAMGIPRSFRLTITAGPL
ncbi:MAG: TonB-dependent receptor [Pseudomonadota bacterium]